MDRDYWSALMNTALNLRVHKPYCELVKQGNGTKQRCAKNADKKRKVSTTERL